MDKLNLLSELNGKELDKLMAYIIPYTDENKINIKNKFAENYANLKEDRMRKRTKFTITIVAAALLCLTTITVFAASQGTFYGLFRNLSDVADYVQSPGQRVTSSGITMELSSYLADDSGIAMELAFTKNDGSIFAADTVGIGCLDRLLFRATPYETTVLRGAPEVHINERWHWTSPTNIISDDGKTYRSFIVAHYNIAEDDTLLDISVNRLIYNMESRHETVHIDLYQLYQDSDVIDIALYSASDYDQALLSLFDNIQDTPTQTESGIKIHSIVFVRAQVTSNTEYDISGFSDYIDGVDIAGLLPFNYFVGIKYTSRIELGRAENHFIPIGLHNNLDPFGIGIIDSETNIGYQFFRVSCIDALINYGVNNFSFLQDIGGIDFTVVSNNFIAGDWHIQTHFSANRESSHILLDKTIDIGDPNVVLTLFYADISLFSTTIALDVRDSRGNIVHSIPRYIFNFMSSEDTFTLRYKSGEEIPLQLMQSSADCSGKNWFTSFMPMSHEYFVIMNTSQLTAMVINGVEFPVE